MSRFFPPGEFHGSEAPLQLMPLRFERTDAKEYLVSNIVGDFIRLSADEFQRLIDADAFLEWADVHGNRYGSPRAPVRIASGSGTEPISRRV